MLKISSKKEQGSVGGRSYSFLFLIHGHELQCYILEGIAFRVDTTILFDNTVLDLHMLNLTKYWQGTYQIKEHAWYKKRNQKTCTRNQYLEPVW